jgi:hypothetical protein
MNRYLRFFGLGIAVVALSGCQYLSAVGDADTGARRAAKVALTAYADFVQPAILTYGRLAYCDPAPKPLCRSRTWWPKIKAYEATASSSVAAAGAVIDSGGSDQGKINQAITDIDAVVAAFKAAREEQ